jgi:hypothetical protein
MKKQQMKLLRQKSIKFRFQREREMKNNEDSGENIEKIEICKKYKT